MGDGIKGLIKDGGSGRRSAIEKMCQSMGGKLEALYYAFGEPDVYVSADIPDNVSAAALALQVNATGLVRVRTTVLLTPEAIDRAAKKTVDYRPPGKLDPRGRR